jgi:hypothetical protein
MFGTTHYRNALHRALMLATLCGFIAGCSGDSRPAPVNSAQAQEALKTALESWKEKKSIDAVRSASAITVQDQDWEAGLQLVSYKIQGSGKAVDAHLYSLVELVLRDQAGKEIRKTVTYMITTSPHITVFRKVL